MNLFKSALITAALALSANVQAALISTLASFDNTGGLIAGDQNNSIINDWATASVFHVGENNIVIERMTAVFGSTTDDTARYLEIGIYESTGTHGVDLAPGSLIGSFDTSVIQAGDTRFSIDLAAYGSFALAADRDYLLVWNARPGAPFLGTKRGGTPDRMINDGTAGFFTGEILSSVDAGASWFSTNQYGFDYVSFDAAVPAVTAFTGTAAITAVPLPAAAWLFVTGLAGLAGVAGRKPAS